MEISPITTQLPTIPSVDFTKDKVIGRGGFGQVYLGSWQATPVAVKELLVQTISDISLKIFQSEAQLMAQCNHPNTVRLFGLCLEKGKLALIMEYLEKGSLYGMLRDTEVPIAWSRRFSIATDMGRGLAYLHAQNIIHRDLKSLNVLIARDDSAKITDFGFAKTRLESSSHMTTTQQGGTVRWTAPELFQPNVSANTASDVYSLGMVIWEIATRRIPFSNTNNEGLVIAWKLNNAHEIIPTDCPEEYAAIIQKCWKLPSERPPAKTVALELNHLQQNAKYLNLEPPKPMQAPAPSTENSVSYLSNSYLSNLPNQMESISISPAKKAELPSIAFGKVCWEKYFGDIGVEPPLPPNIKDILAASCPFFPGKKVQETHLLTLIPKTVNGNPFTLNSLGELVKKPKQGSAAQYYSYWDEIQKTLGCTPIQSSYWVLFTKDVLPDSRNKTYDAQKELVASYSKKGNVPYEVPRLLEAATSIFMEYVQSGTTLYNNSPQTFTRCQERLPHWLPNRDKPLSIGGFFAPAGPTVNYYLSLNYYVTGNDYDGVAALWKF